MNKWLEILVGLVVLTIAILAWVTWLPEWGLAALKFLKGGILWVVILIGLALVILGISDLKN